MIPPYAVIVAVYVTVKLGNHSCKVDHLAWIVAEKVAHAGRSYLHAIAAIMLYYITLISLAVMSAVIAAPIIAGIFGVGLARYCRDYRKAARPVENRDKLPTVELDRLCRDGNVDIFCRRSVRQQLGLYGDGRCRHAQLSRSLGKLCMPLVDRLLIGAIDRKRLRHSVLLHDDAGIIAFSAALVKPPVEI